MQEHPPCTVKIYNFWDYTLTTRRDRIDAASTLQTYHNVWTLIREQKTGLSIPQSLKGPMADVSTRLRYCLRYNGISNQKVGS
jgi:hypothetical protein